MSTDVVIILTEPRDPKFCPFCGSEHVAGSGHWTASCHLDEGNTVVVEEHCCMVCERSFWT